METLASLCLDQLLLLDLHEGCFIVVRLPEILQDNYRILRRQKELLFLCGNTVTQRLKEERKEINPMAREEGLRLINRFKEFTSSTIFFSEADAKRGIYNVGMFMASYRYLLSYYYMKEEEDFAEWFVPYFRHKITQLRRFGQYNRFNEAAGLQSSIERIASFAYPN